MLRTNPYTPSTKPDAAPVRLIVRRVKPTPGSQRSPSSPDPIWSSFFRALSSCYHRGKRLR